MAVRFVAGRRLGVLGVNGRGAIAGGATRSGSAGAATVAPFASTTPSAVLAAASATCAAAGARTAGAALATVQVRSFEADRRRERRQQARPLELVDEGDDGVRVVGRGRQRSGGGKSRSLWSDDSGSNRGNAFDGRRRRGGGGGSGGRGENRFQAHDDDWMPSDRSFDRGSGSGGSGGGRKRKARKKGGNQQRTRAPLRAFGAHLDDPVIFERGGTADDPNAPSDVPSADNDVINPSGMPVMDSPLNHDLKKRLIAKV